MEKLLWLDIETTGLDELNDLILEVGMVVTNENLEILDTYSAVIAQDKEKFLPRMNSHVLKMHVNNGLIDDVCNSKKTETAVAFEMKDFITLHFEDKNKPTLHGNTVHFDKKFIKEFWSELDDLFHYRIVDVSSIKIFMKRHFGVEYPKEGEPAHRAIDDIHHSIREYKFLMEWIKGYTAPLFNELVNA